MAILGNDQFYNALESLKELISMASDLAKGVGKEKQPAEVATRLITKAQTGLSDIQDTYESLADTKMKLEQQVLKLKAWEEEKANYECADLAAGVFAYVKRPKAGTAGPDEWYCPKCFHNSKTSLLVPGENRTHKTMNCRECRNELRVSLIDRFNTRTSR